MSLSFNLKKARSSLFGPLLVTILFSVSANVTAETEFELSGQVGIEERVYFSKGQFEGQLDDSQPSIYIEPELYWSFNEGNDSIVFKPFFRVDGQDKERTHGDIRELSYIHASDDWELRLGIRKEFWGVTEFQHLVDVINQTDSVEDMDGEDKLGQMMVNLSLVRDWGIVDMYVLPGFRERTFAGVKGRLRGPFVVDNNNVEYESSDRSRHVDYAIRWSHNIGDFDFGGYYFNGTNRDPILLPKEKDEKIVLQQYYGQMEQFGVDIQATIGDWLYKFEGIHRDTKQESFWASQAGFEYSFIGVFETFADLGVLMEYSWDSRGEGSLTENGAVFQNDLFLGTRLALNDAQSSELLVGISSDLDHSGTSFLFEGSRRFGDNITASLDIRLFQSSHITDQLYALKEDDHVQLSLAYYY